MRRQAAASEVWPTVPDIMWTAYQSQSRSLMKGAEIRLVDGTQVLVNLALLEGRAPSLAALVVDGAVDLTPSGLKPGAVRTVIDFVHSDRPTETTDVPSLLPILHAADYCGAAALKEKVVSTLRDRVAGSDPKTLLAIANEARSRQASDLYAAAAAQLAETAPRELLETVDSSLLAQVVVEGREAKRPRPSTILAVGGRGENFIRLYDLATAVTRTEDVYDRIDLEESVRGLSFSADGKYLVSSTETMIQLWNPITGERLRTIRTDSANMNFQNVSCANKKPLCAVASSHGLDVWDLTSEEDRPQYIIRCYDFETSMISWSPDDAILLADLPSFESAGAILWHFADHDADGRRLEIKHPDPEKANDSDTTRCIFSKDGHYVICGWNRGDITFWDLRSGRTTRQLNRHTNYIDALALSRDGKLLASSCQEYKICIWIVASSECAHELCGHSYLVFGLAFTNDNTILISGGCDRRIILWDTATGSSRKKWGSRQRVYAVDDDDEDGYGDDHNDEDDGSIVIYGSLTIL